MSLRGHPIRPLKTATAVESHVSGSLGGVRLYGNDQSRNPDKNLLSYQYLKINVLTVMCCLVSMVMENINYP